MLLFAVAVVFIGLGWHSAATSGNDPKKDLAAVEQSTEAGSGAEAASDTSAPSESTPSSTSAAPRANTPRVCVFNAGTVTGLAKEVSDELEDQGFRMAEPGNLSTSSITENTLFYEDGDKAAADRVADALAGEVSVEERPSTFTNCADGLALIVVTR